MARILKRVDYLELLSFIYKNSEYNQEKATILFNFISYNLLQHGFKEIYINKLSIDLKLIKPDDEQINYFDYSKKAYATVLAEMENNFSFYTQVEMKVMTTDIMQKGYYE